MNQFRALVMAAVSEAYDEHDDTPDYLLVSWERFERLGDESLFELLKDGTRIGYLGMVVIPTDAVADNDVQAILVSEEVMDGMTESFL